MDFVVVDIETTGLSKFYHKITEIAAVRVKDNQIIDQYQTLVNPQERIPSFITQLTGITNDMVANAPVIEQVLPQFLDFLGPHVFVGHNATFDHGFLSVAAFKHHKRLMTNQRICTRRLASRLLPDLPSKRLGMLCNVFGIQNAQAHRAMGDAQATAQVLLRFVDMLKLCDVHTLEDILKFQSKPRNECAPMMTSIVAPHQDA